MNARVGLLGPLTLVSSVVGSASAQPARKTPRIGRLSACTATAPPPPRQGRAFFEDLRALGYVEGLVGMERPALSRRAEVTLRPAQPSVAQSDRGKEPVNHEG